MRYSILVCDRGWVLVGIVTPHPTNPLKVIVNRCNVIRVWGTTQGLGQLALEGPVGESTILDPEGDNVELHDDYIARTIHCSPKANKAWHNRIG